MSCIDFISIKVNNKWYKFQLSGFAHGPAVADGESLEVKYVQRWIGIINDEKLKNEFDQLVAGDQVYDAMWHHGNDYTSSIEKVVRIFNQTDRRHFELQTLHY